LANTASVSAEVGDCQNSLNRGPNGRRKPGRLRFVLPSRIGQVELVSDGDPAPSRRLSSAP